MSSGCHVPSRSASLPSASHHTAITSRGVYWAGHNQLQGCQSYIIAAADCVQTSNTRQQVLTAQRPLRLRCLVPIVVAHGTCNSSYVALASERRSARTEALALCNHSYAWHGVGVDTTEFGGLQLAHLRAVSGQQAHTSTRKHTNE